MRLLLSLAAMATLAAACAPEAPDQPTWVDDVRPILQANCIRCHSAPPIGGAPDYLRLDRYSDELTADGGDVLVIGAAGAAPTIAAYTGQELMPPRLPLTSRQKDILQTWFDAGAPRGERPDNLPPTITLESAPAVDEDGRVILLYEIEDPDDDLVVGVLRADPAAPGQEPELISNQLLSGRGQVSWNTGGLVPGPYTLVVELEDGDEPVFKELGAVEVLP
jgi:hypothetical protein